MSNILDSQRDRLARHSKAREQDVESNLYKNTHPKNTTGRRTSDTQS